MLQGKQIASDAASQVQANLPSMQPLMSQNQPETQEQGQGQNRRHRNRGRRGQSKEGEESQQGQQEQQQGLSVTDKISQTVQQAVDKVCPSLKLEMIKTYIPKYSHSQLLLFWMNVALVNRAKISLVRL
jgi:hypothetical protein